MDGWEKAKKIFGDAIKFAPAERIRFLDEVCDGDKTVRREVESLLASYDEAESFMENPAVAEVADVIESNGKKLGKGKCFGHYEIIKQLGAGGMGEVYLAKDKKLDRKVAVKILNERFSRDESNLDRFIQEAKAASALNHPNILVIHEIGEADDVHFIVSEFIKGKTLREIFKGKTLKLSEVLDVSIQIANALCAAHEAHLIHRDIKPENIMIRPDGFAKILDFGLAKLIEQQNSFIGFEDETVKQNQTAKGVILGTVKYMSPEQAKAENVDARTDIFSFGVLLYEMTAGRTPFAGDSMSETFANLINAEPQPLSRFSSNVPDELQRIVSKMLKKNRDARYQTMKDLLADLKSLRENLAFDERLEKSHSPAAENATKILQARTGDATLQTAETDYSFVRQIRRHKSLAAGTLIVLLAAISFGVRYFTNRAADTKHIESIAVLPFVNESGNADVEYLSDGMTETLISSLSQIPKLNVKARSSVFRYKGKETDAQTIGKELNVPAIVHGRVVQRGQDLILYVELVDAATENVLWKSDYNRPMTNLVSLQTEIARDVSNKLRLKLSGADEQKLAKNYTENAEAYKLYLQGRFYWNKRTGDGLKKSIEYFNRAIEEDPSYALAYAGLADAYVLFPVYSIGSPKDFYPKAKASAKKALLIDETLAEAHTALAMAIFYYDWNLPESDKEFRRAIELNPNYSTAHHWYGSSTLAVMARFDEAVAEVKRAQELDPLSLVINVDLAYPYLYARQYDKAIEQLKKTIEMEQNFDLAHSTLGVAYAAKGLFPEAIAAYQKALQLNDDPYSKALLGHAYGASGKRNEALKIIEQIEEISKQRYIPAYSLAIVYIALGDKDKAFAELEKSYQDHANEMMFLQVDPLLDPLRDDPRFQDLLRRVGSPQ